MECVTSEKEEEKTKTKKTALSQELAWHSQENPVFFLLNINNSI